MDPVVHSLVSRLWARQKSFLLNSISILFVPIRSI